MGRSVPTIYLAKKEYEPLLLIPIAFGILLVNLPSEIMKEGSGLLWILYHYGEEWAIIPPLIFLGIGAMTDFGSGDRQPQNPCSWERRRRVGFI